MSARGASRRWARSLAALRMLPALTALLAASLVAVDAEARDFGEKRRARDDEGELAHEGPYIRFSLGPAGTFAAAESPDGARTDPIRSGGVSLQLAGGSTVARGVVLGGMLSMADAGNAHLPKDVGVGTLNLFVAGPFVDFYPDDTSGLHFGGLVGYAGANYGQDAAAGAGGAVLAWAGYDLWVFDNWSLGASLQAHAALLHGNHVGLGPADDPHRFGDLAMMVGYSLQLGFLYN